MLSSGVFVHRVPTVTHPLRGSVSWGGPEVAIRGAFAVGLLGWPFRCLPVL